MNKINPLTEEQLNNQPVPKSKGPFIVRFITRRQTVQHLGTGELAPVGTNVIYLTHFWDVHQKWIDYIIDCLSDNNPGRSFRAEKSKA